MAEIKLSQAGIRRMLTVDVAPAVREATARIAAGTEAAAGTVHGHPVAADVDADIVRSGRRYRGAIIVHHPTPKGRAAGKDALTAAAQAQGYTVTAPTGGAGLVEYVTKAGTKRMATPAQVANWTRGSST